MPIILECPPRSSDKTGILYFDKVAFKSEARILRPFAVATPWNLSPAVFKPYFVSESPAEFVKNKIPRFFSHLEILTQYD